MANRRATRFLRDEGGNVIGGSNFKVRVYSTYPTVLATLYKDSAGALSRANPGYGNSGWSTTLAATMAPAATSITVVSTTGAVAGDVFPVIDGVNTVYLVVSTVTDATHLALVAAPGGAVTYSIGSTVNDEGMYGHWQAFVADTQDYDLTFENVAAGRESPPDPVYTGIGSFTVFDAAGDLVYASAADTAARLAIGANYFQVLGVTSALPAWQFSPMFNPALYWTFLETAVILAARVGASGGAVATAESEITLSTSAAANSWAKYVVPVNAGSGTVDTNVWTKLKHFSFLGTPRDSIAAGDTIFVGWNDTALATKFARASTRKYIGFCYDSTTGGNWLFIACDGATNETVVDTGIAVANNTDIVLAVNYDGTTATPYVNGVAKTAITTNLPAGSSASYMKIIMYVDNKTTAANRELGVTLFRGAASVT